MVANCAGVRGPCQDSPGEGGLHGVQPVPVPAEDALPRYRGREQAGVHRLPAPLLHLHPGGAR